MCCNSVIEFQRTTAKGEKQTKQQEPSQLSCDAGESCTSVSCDVLTIGAVSAAGVCVSVTAGAAAAAATASSLEAAAAGATGSDADSAVLDWAA